MKASLVSPAISQRPQYLFLPLLRWAPSASIFPSVSETAIPFNVWSMWCCWRYFTRSSLQSKTSDKNRHKKPKDVLPKVKKLKYHQYIPPDQKAEKSPPPMDSAYARLLQQQQLFLQLQILSQQKHAHAQTQSQHLQMPQAQVQAQQKQPAFSYQPHHQNQAQKWVSPENKLRS